MKILPPNTLIQNRYLIIQLVGKGGMGEVYLAIDQRLGSTIALKRTLFTDDQTLNKAFEREAKILARLRHPILPKVSDHFAEDDMQYLVMEHIAGDDLAKRLELSNKPFSLNWVLFWANQLLDVLAYLHSHEPPIIHRDIKPQNLKLTSDNHIVLLDFGLVKNTVGETRLSLTGSISGYTPHYASMEQIRGTGTVAQSDIYSLSVTLYQLLTNVVPPDALSRADGVLSGFGDSVTPINEINPEVPKPISDVIIKGMNLSIDGRYQSAKEMQIALREALATPTMQSVPMKSISYQPSVADFKINEVADLIPIISENEVSESVLTQSKDSSLDNSDVTVQVIHFKGIGETQVDTPKQPEISENSFQTFALKNSKPIVNSEIGDKKEIPVSQPNKSTQSPKSNKNLYSVVAGIAVVGILLAIISIYFYNSSKPNEIIAVPIPTVSPMDSVQPSTEPTLPREADAYTSTNTNVDNTNVNTNINQSSENEVAAENSNTDKPVNTSKTKALENKTIVKKEASTKSPNNLPKRDPKKVF